MDSELITEAIQIARDNRDIFCVGLLQRKLKIGSIKCAKLIDVLENGGIVGPYNPKNNLRKVLV